MFSQRRTPPDYAGGALARHVTTHSVRFSVGGSPMVVILYYHCCYLCCIVLCIYSKYIYKLCLLFISTYCSRLSFSSYASSKYISDRNPGRRFALWMGTTLLGMPSQRVGSQDRLHTLRFVAYFNGSLIIQICSNLKDLRYLSIQKKHTRNSRNGTTPGWWNQWFQIYPVSAQAQHAAHVLHSLWQLEAPFWLAEFIYPLIGLSPFLNG